MQITYALGIHILTVLSLEAEARTSPSGENFTSVTTPCGGQGEQRLKVRDEKRYRTEIVSIMALNKLSSRRIIICG